MTDETMTDTIMTNKIITDKNMTGKTIFNEMTFNKMIFNQMTFIKIAFNKMVFNKMVFTNFPKILFQITFPQRSSRSHLNNQLFLLPKWLQPTQNYYLTHILNYLRDLKIHQNCTNL